PAPDADVNSVGAENFEWVVEHAANLAIECAQAQKPGQDNLTWGTFVQKSASLTAISSVDGSVEVGGTVNETNDLGATGLPAESQKPAPKKPGAPKPEAPEGSVPKPKPAPKPAPAGAAPAKPKKPAPKK
ncbi:MAG: glutathione synthase, partial [Cytophagaceae bacterium]